MVFDFLSPSSPESLFFQVLPFLFVACFGLILGSFSTAIAHRAPEGVPWYALRGGASRSHCPQCGVALRIRDLIPVLSWLFLKGRCGRCQASIPLLYPVTECTLMLACLVVYGARGQVFGAETLLFMATLPFLWALVVVDFRYKILPDTLVVTVGVLGLLRLAFLFLAEEADVWPYVLGGLGYGMVSFFLGWGMSRLMKRDTLGLGDVKFFIVAGVWLGLGLLADFFILSGLAGIGLSVLWRMKTGESIFPFGPALILSFYIVFLLGGSLFV